MPDAEREGHVCTKMLLGTCYISAQLFVAVLLGYHRNKMKAYYIGVFFLCKKQVRPNLHCAKYEWEVRGMWEKSVSQNLYRLL